MARIASLISARPSRLRLQLEVEQRLFHCHITGKLHTPRLVRYDGDLTWVGCSGCTPVAHRAGTHMQPALQPTHTEWHGVQGGVHVA